MIKHLTNYGLTLGDRSLFFRRLGFLQLFLSPFHLVTTSPWPFLFSWSLLIFILGVALFLHGFPIYVYLLKIGFFLLFWSFLRWIRDVIYEGFVQGVHTDVVQHGLRIGFILFIFSEVMFFFAFFWAFFHSSLAPILDVGSGWPSIRNSPMMLSDYGFALYTSVIGIDVFDPWFVPFLNTLLLLTSGVWLTFAHAEIQHSCSDEVLIEEFFGDNGESDSLRYLPFPVFSDKDFFRVSLLYMYFSVFFVFYLLKLLFSLFMARVSRFFGLQ